MQAARLYAPREIRVEEMPTPEPGPGEVLVRVRAVSICPSDLRLYEENVASGGVVPDHPMILGHEFSGEIAAFGPGVSAPALGTRVAVEPSWACHECDMCLRDLPNLCRHIIFPSFPQRDGALAEFIVCPADSVYALPASVSFVAGALVEPLGVAIHALRLSAVTPEDRAIVLGAGAIGMFVMLLARLQGVASLALVEPIAGRRAWPERLGVSPVVATAEELRAAGVEADVVFECSGDNRALGQGLPLVRPAGRMIVVGIPHPDEVSFDSAIPRRHELTVTFSRRSRHTLEDGVALLADGRLDLQSFPVRSYTLDQAAEALEATAARPGDMLRAMVTP
jgi:L-iditol 2-dehydrogenase